MQAFLRGDINLEAKKITQKLNISDRVEKLTRRNAYITVKDHKENFHNKVACRLINPTKSNLGKICKQNLDRINNVIRHKTKLRQLKNTKAAIDWFNDIESKKSMQFIQIDIKDYYPSITVEILNKAINFAKQYVNIGLDDVEIIMNASKSILFHDEKIWTKKGNTDNFDIAMGTYHGAEITDLIGLYILDQLKTKVTDVEFGLYRDDGMGIKKKGPKTQLKSTRDRIKDVFKEIGLEITINDSTLTRMDFLDVTFDLNKETYELYKKPNDHPEYINVKSNHPKPVIKNIPKSVNKRLNEISCNEEMFEKHKQEYQEALIKSGYNKPLHYNNNNTQNETEKKKKKNRKRKVIWFNPPFSKNLKTNIGKEFLKLIDKNFPKDNSLNKIINRKTVLNKLQLHSKYA